MKIKSLWRYPVKSLLGESLQALPLDARGVVGDRLYALENSEGKFASGKNTRRFARIDNLFALSAMSFAGQIGIIFPDASVVKEDAADMNQQLSQFFGQKLKLCKEQTVSHFDDGAVHILTSSSLARLQALLPDSQIDARRFRPNLIIDDHSTLISDDDLIGRSLKIGNIELMVTHKTERCRMTTLAQSELGNDPAVLKALAKGFDLHIGVYAKVLQAGVLRVGQRLSFS